MKRYFKPAALSIGSLVVLLFYAGCRDEKNKFPEGLIYISNETFISTANDEKLSGHGVYSYDGSEKSKLQIKVAEKISLNDAKTIMLAKLKQIELLYKDRAIEYSGSISQVAHCNSSFKINYDLAESSNSILSINSLLSTEQFVYGSCSDSSDVMKSQLLFLYCPSSQKLYDIRLFYPRSKETIVNPIFKCI